MHRSQIEQLEVISSLSAEDAKAQLVESLRSEAKTDAMAFIQTTLEEAKMTAQQDAKKIIINTIQRIGTEEAIENCVSVFNLESDDVKDGLLAAKGEISELLKQLPVSKSLWMILLRPLFFCFDSVRRKSLDFPCINWSRTVGYIRPYRGNNQKTTKQIEEEIPEVGKRTVIDLGIHGLHPELIKAVGRMKYCSSYGQNLYTTLERWPDFVALWLPELGLNAKLAKRAGLCTI